MNQYTWCSYNYLHTHRRIGTQRNSAEGNDIDKIHIDVPIMLIHSVRMYVENGYPARGFFV